MFRATVDPTAAAGGTALRPRLLLLLVFSVATLDPTWAAAPPGWPDVVGQPSLKDRQPSAAPPPPGPGKRSDPVPSPTRRGGAGGEAPPKRAPARDSSKDKPSTKTGPEPVISPRRLNKSNAGGIPGVSPGPVAIGPNITTAAAEDPRQCKVFGTTPSISTCGGVAAGLILVGLLTTFWGTRSNLALGFWVGFVLGFIISMMLAREVFDIREDDLVLFVSILVGLAIGISSMRVPWIAHALTALLVTGFLIYCSVTFGPYFAHEFGNHWWLWSLAFLLALPVILCGWKLYRLVAFIAKTALGALLVTTGVEYFVNAYTTFLNRGFLLLRLVDGSQPSCHGSTCVLTISFWFFLTLIGCFVHNFGVTYEEKKPRRKMKPDPEAEIKQRSPQNETDPINFDGQPMYDSTGETEGHVFGGPAGHVGDREC